MTYHKDRKTILLCLHYGFGFQALCGLIAGFIWPSLFALFILHIDLSVMGVIVTLFILANDKENALKNEMDPHAAPSSKQASASASA